METTRYALALLLALPLAAPAQDAEPATADELVAADRAEAGDDTVAVPEEVPLEEIQRFVSVFRAVEQAYVEPVEDDRLMRAAVRGLLTDLDPHSAYLEADQASSLNEQAAGAYGGLGLEVLQQPDRTLLVVAPIDDTPAARAGIRPGDVIVEVDGAPIEADNVDMAVESMRGEPGTEITLTLLREGLADAFEVTLTREVIRVASVGVELLEPGFGYARISFFQADTASEFRRKLERLLEGEQGRGLRGLVIDLRSNPGGLLNAAVDMADLFLDRGVIVSTRGRLPAANAIHRATPGMLLEGTPLVVLIDAGTASASEVLAGALSDHRRAVVMGATSFGKGSVQTVLPLDNGDAIKLTTARYYTPDGVSIQAAGIVPDIAIDEALVLRRAGDRAPTVRESNLPGHLRSEGIEVAPVEAYDGTEDYAVNEALNLLKGLAVLTPEPAGDEADAGEGEGP